MGNIGGSEDECCVCLTTHGPLCLLACSAEHAVHVECGIEWARRCRAGTNSGGVGKEPTCPVCRTPFREADLVIRPNVPLSIRPSSV